MTCLTLAIASITQTETALHADMLDAASWPVMYTLFLSIVYIVGLRACEAEFLSAEQAGDHVASGLRLLKLCCGGNGVADHVLRLLQVSSLRSSKSIVD